MSGKARKHWRKDYREPDHRVERVDLAFDLREDHVVVRARLEISRTEHAAPDARLQLDGEELELLALRINGEKAVESSWRLTGSGGLDIDLDGAATAVVETEVRIRPHQNTALSGLYVSEGMFCTQCEAEGFRRITFYPDRPDVMARFRVRVEAEHARFPVLLSNGNRIEEGNLEGGRHFAVFEDPYPKPSYLFALVAGDLRDLHELFVTSSGNTVDLHLWSDPDDQPRLAWAMECLKRAMRWDEQVFGLEYDLDVFHVVAARQFNMGAMENKGLNVFNASYLLASPETASDEDHELVEGVIGHEYFHNWTGNRVTCRDWFQLTLKEGLTVYRDQRFSAEMRSAAVKRIEDVRMLRGRQFPEDAGPLKHPIRPEAYEAMDNFYTSTVYLKGSEVVRLYETLLGKEGFRRGMDLYFERHDGCAVSCDDFRSAMADANGRDLSSFERWYEQAGTPVVTADGMLRRRLIAYACAKAPLALTLRRRPCRFQSKPDCSPPTVGSSPAHESCCSKNASKSLCSRTSPSNRWPLCCAIFQRRSACGSSKATPNLRRSSRTIRIPSIGGRLGSGSPRGLCSRARARVSTACRPRNRRASPVHGAASSPTPRPIPRWRRGHWFCQTRNPSLESGTRRRP